MIYRNLNLLIALIFILCLTACTSSKNSNYKFNKKYSTVAFKEDITLLKNVLEKHHPSLYWYNTKDSIDFLFSKLQQYQAKDSLSELDCRNKLQEVIEQIKCGHTTVRFSKEFNNLMPAKIYPLFPLQIKTWKDSLVVLARYNLADSMLKRGTIITSINNRKPAEIIHTLFKLLSTDGNANNHKSQVISGNFPLWYKYGFGLDSIYTIGYIDDLGKETFTNIKWYKPIIDTSKKIKQRNDSTAKVNKPTKKQIKNAALLAKRSMVIDSSANTAYIKLATFSGGRLPTFFRKSFRKINTEKIEHVIFDIRENGGGRVNNAILLTKYLHQLAFKVGDTIAAKKPSFAYNKFIGLHWAYTIAKVFGSKKMEDGLWHNRTYETKYFAPKSKYHFNGKIYIIQGGYSFSAATLFAGWLKNQNNVTIVGEESGGAFYGNSAMFIPTILLPNTRLRVSLPLYKLVMDKDRPKGWGILPDVEIPPSSFAIKKGVDLKIEGVKKLIQQATKQQ